MYKTKKNGACFDGEYTYETSLNRTVWNYKKKKH